MREMKDSGIEWIGQIPKDWKVKNLKYFVSFQTGGTPRNKEGIDSYGDFSWFTPSDLENNNLVNSKFFISSDAVKNNGYNLFPPNSILLCCIASVGKVGFNLYASYSNQQITSLIPFTNTQSKFIFYFMIASKDKISFDASSNVVPIINTKYLSSFSICFPDFVVQQQIANFLDTQCSEIDATAEDIQKEISLLEDYKKSLIYNVISYGINHSAYSTETDEVWGNVPQGWKLVDIKYLFEIVKRIAGKEGYDVLSVTQKGLKVKDITSGDGQLADNYSGYQFVYPTDYVMNHMDLLTGWVDCSEFFGVTSPDYRVFRLMDKAANNLVYYKYVMQCCYMNKIFYSLGQGVSNLGRWRLQTSSFNNFKVPVPPKAEQDEIADYLDTQCSEIDTLIADKKRQLDILADYKKSLIYEYVTGKKEVPVNE